MDYIRKSYNRRTIRLQNYDYTQPGFYFVTICTSKKKRTPISTPRVSHSSNVPERFKRYMHANSAIIPASTPPPHPVGRDKSGPYDDASRLHHASTLPALGEIVRTFKAVSTHDIRLSEKPNFAWQSRYYEHIIRNDKDLDRIREYIVNNPAHWEKDSLNIKEGFLV